jgi:hypothetical protein
MVVKGIFDNWRFGRIHFASGLPFAVYGDTDGADIVGGGDGWRTMLIGEPKISHGSALPDRWFNTSADASSGLSW